MVTITARPIIFPRFSSPCFLCFDASLSIIIPGTGEIGIESKYVRPKISVNREWVSTSPGNHQFSELLNQAWNELIRTLTGIENFKLVFRLTGITHSEPCKKCKIMK